MWRQNPGKSFSDTELGRSLPKKSLLNNRFFYSKPIIIKLTNPVLDAHCPSCSTVETPLLLPGAKKSVSERIGDIASHEHLKNENAEPEDFDPMKHSLESSSSESISTDEIIHLLPTGEEKNKSEKKPNKYLNMRIKDEIKIDLKHESLTSLLSFRCPSHNKIYPIEELTENSSNESVKLAVKEQERIDQISRIIANAITKANNRPETRRVWVAEKANSTKSPKTDYIRINSVESLNFSLQKDIKKDSEPIVTQSKITIPTITQVKPYSSKSFTLERYLSEESVGLETTDADKLIDKSIASEATNHSSLKTYSDSFFSMDMTNVSAASSCCVGKCISKLFKSLSAGKGSQKKGKRMKVA